MKFIDYGFTKGDNEAIFIYAAKSYEIRLEYKEARLYTTFVRQRYLDAEGRLVEFLGAVDSPFPRNMILQ